jgi:hypothetical protein
MPKPNTLLNQILVRRRLSYNICDERLSGRPRPLLFSFCWWRKSSSAYELKHHYRALEVVCEAWAKLHGCDEKKGFLHPSGIAPRATAWKTDMLLLHHRCLNFLLSKSIACNHDWILRLHHVKDHGALLIKEGMMCNIVYNRFTTYMTIFSFFLESLR